jgi:two-component system nitrogen regulation response regulator GlnG
LVRRLAALYSEEVIGVDAVDAELADDTHAETPVEGNGISDSVEHHLRSYFLAHGDGLPATGLYERVLREVERPLIALSLQATRGNQIKAAQLLGLNRNTLRKKIRELDISVSRGAPK